LGHLTNNQTKVTRGEIACSLVIEPLNKNNDS